MHRLKLFFVLFFMYISVHNVYADSDVIKIGLTKYSQTSSITINNDNLSFSTNYHNNFNTDFSFLVKDGVVLKPMTGYSIKINDAFDSYNNALYYKNEYDNSFIIKGDDYYYIAINTFDNKDDALIFMENKDIDGDIINVKSYIGIYEADNLNIAIKDSIYIKNMDKNIIYLNNKGYRNIIQVNSLNNRLNTINILDIEEYLYGVVPLEMPYSWELEALKSQSVAARNYAKGNMHIHEGSGYNLCDTTHCQVYGGVNNEKDTTTRAVDETRGIYAYYDDKLINATYFSSSGGYTANAENVWNESVPYLRSIKDDMEKGYKKWERNITFDEITRVLNIGDVTEIVLEYSNFNNRVLSLKFIGSDGEKILLKENIRTFFSKFKDGSLPSRNFNMIDSNNIEKISNNNQIFAISKDKKYTLDLSNINILNASDINKSELYTVNKDDKITPLSLSDESENIDNISNNKSISILKKSDNNTITFVGKGFGHGVGMSQYGANSLAKNGYTYDEILKYYYTDIVIK